MQNIYRKSTTKVVLFMYVFQIIDYNLNTEYNTISILLTSIKVAQSIEKTNIDKIYKEKIKFEDNTLYQIVIFNVTYYKK